jgi:hypothetical protein
MLSAFIPTAVAATTVYWTASDSYAPQNLTKYHVFLDESYPSSAFKAAKIANEHLNVCLDFSPSNIVKPYICHQVPTARIPPFDDSIINAGFFVVPSSLNPSEAGVCIAPQHHDMYSCAG